MDPHSPPSKLILYKTPIAVQTRGWIALEESMVVVRRGRGVVDDQGRLWRWL